MITCKGQFLGLVISTVSLPIVVSAQGAFPTPIQMTFGQAGKRANDVYAPRMINQIINGKSTLVMYFGGWYRTDPTTLPNDSIYRAVCSSPSVCGVAQKVIDPVADGLGSASLVNNPTIVELHNGGQDYYVMYMTGVTGTDTSAGYTITNNKIYYSTSYASDGINWSIPKLLITDGWLPSATLDQNNNVVLYANTNGSTNPNFLSKYNLGTSGAAVLSYQSVTNNDSISYDNVEVKYRPSIKLWQIVAQQDTGQFNSEIDYLDSTDGVNWVLRSANITPAGMTPGVYPTTSCYVYYGNTPASYQSDIFLKSWC